MLFAHYASELSTLACMDGTVQSVILPLYWALLKKEYSQKWECCMDVSCPKNVKTCLFS